MELTRSPAVHAALVALLADQAPQLASTPSVIPGDPFRATDTELRRAFNAKIDWTHLDSRQRRAYLDSLNRAPPAAPTL